MQRSLRERIYHTVFFTETPAGKNFDLVLLWIILLSVITVVLESVSAINAHFYQAFFVLEWIFTILFSLEYIMRILISPKPAKYIFSFWGMIDLLSVLPTLLSLLIPGAHFLLVVRIFRLLRVFRILKLARFNAEANLLVRAMKDSLYKISIFLFAVLSIVILLGTIMYVLEKPEDGFTSIPQSIYWAIITITTVGYGDVVPHTVLGKMFSSVAMIIGYAIIAVPTGIITVAMSKTKDADVQCRNCKADNKAEYNYCHKCGEKMAVDTAIGNVTNNETSPF